MPSIPERSKTAPSQRLSVLAEKESALGSRASEDPAGKAKGRTTRAQAKAQKASGAASPETICGEPAERAVDAKPMRQMRVRQVLARNAASELDDAEEFEGTQGLYDSAYAAKRGISRLRAPQGQRCLRAKRATRLAIPRNRQERLEPRKGLLPAQQAQHLTQLRPSVSAGGRQSRKCGQRSGYNHDGRGSSWGHGCCRCRRRAQRDHRIHPHMPHGRTDRVSPLRVLGSRRTRSAR